MVAVMSDTSDLRDELPDDLNASEYVGPYQFPDNSRRRKPAALYLVMAAVCLVLGAFGIFSFTSGWRMQVDEKQALVAAQGAVGFAVGHASAQQVWRGLRSRPTWRVLAYSAENPPRQRALVLVDAIEGGVLEHIIENNPEEDWSE
jgi:hypothetical protein